MNDSVRRKFRGNFASCAYAGSHVCLALWLLAGGSALSGEKLVAAFPQEIATWTDDVRDLQRAAAAQLSADLQAAISRGESDFVIAEGNYRFGDSKTLGLRVFGASNLRITATGATFWFEPRIRSDAVLFRNCNNVSLTGVTIDYDPAAYFQGRIVAIDPRARTVDVKLDVDFARPDASWTEHAGRVKTIFFDRRGIMREARMDWATGIEDLGDDNFRVSFKLGNVFEFATPIRIGDRLCLPDRSMRMAVNIEHSETVTLEDVTIFAAPQMAITEFSGEGGHTYRRCRVTRRPNTGRLLACNADVFHSTGVQRGPLIEDCEFAYAGDDLVNIHGYWGVVLDSPSPTTLRIVQQNGGGFSQDESLQLFDWSRWTTLGNGQVASVSNVTDSEALAIAAKLRDRLVAQGDHVTVFDQHHSRIFQIEFADRVDVKPASLVMSQSSSGAGAILRNNRFHDGFCRGVLSRSSNSVIENNQFERIGMGGIVVMADRGDLEGPFPHDIRIIENTLVDCGMMLDSRLRMQGSLGAINVETNGGRDMMPTTHYANIEIRKNKIVRPGACGIFVSNLRNSSIENNVIDTPCARPALRQKTSHGLKVPGHAIFVTASENIEVRKNVVKRPTADCHGEVGFGVQASAAQNGR